MNGKIYTNQRIHKELVTHTCDAVTSPLEKSEVEGEKEYLLSKDDEIDRIENEN